MHPSTVCTFRKYATYVGGFLLKPMSPSHGKSLLWLSAGNQNEYEINIFQWYERGKKRLLPILNSRTFLLKPIRVDTTVEPMMKCFV